MERMISMKFKMLKKEDGQMIILAGFFVGVAIVALTILLNQIILSGYQVSKSELDDTKYDLSSLRAETVRTIKRAAYDSWGNAATDGTADQSEVRSSFDLYMANFSKQIPGIYMQYGKIVNVTNFNIKDFDSENYIEDVSFEMTYTDGVNSYSANVSVENIRLTEGVYGSDKGTHMRRVLIAFFDPMVVDSNGGITNLTVRVTDEIGNPLPDSLVKFSINTSDKEENGTIIDPLTGNTLANNTTDYFCYTKGNGEINLLYVHNCLKVHKTLIENFNAVTVELLAADYPGDMPELKVVTIPIRTP